MREIRLFEYFSGFITAAIGLEIVGTANRIALQAFLVAAKAVIQRPCHREALACEADSRCHHILQRQGAIFGKCRCQPHNSARHTAGLVAEAGAGIVNVTLVIKEHVTVCPCRCHFAVIQRNHTVLCFEVDHHETTATQVTRLRMGYGQRKTGCHSGVNGIAARTQDLKPGFAGVIFLADHHAVFGKRGVKLGIIYNDRVFILGQGYRGKGQESRHYNDDITQHLHASLPYSSNCLSYE